MKRKHIGMFLLACLPLIASCSGKGGTENNGGTENKDTKTDTTLYSVAHESDDFCKITGSAGFLSGEEASVTVTGKFDAVKIDKVYANGTECTKGSSDNVYVFTMPSENVTVTADYSFVDTKEDNFASFKDDNPTEVKGDSLLYFTCSTSMMTDCDYKVFSRNQDVIKDDALVLYWTKQGSSNIINGGNIEIGSTLDGKDANIHDGTAQIVLYLKSKNGGTTSASCIATTVTVKK